MNETGVRTPKPWRDYIPTPTKMDLAYLKDIFGQCHCKQCRRQSKKKEAAK